jgi:hypothetical protein
VVVEEEPEGARAAMADSDTARLSRPGSSARDLRDEQQHGLAYIVVNWSGGNETSKKKEGERGAAHACLGEARRGGLYTQVIGNKDKYYTSKTRRGGD